MSSRHWLAEQVEQVSLSADDIRKMLGQHATSVRVMLYDDLSKYRTLDDLLADHVAAIVLLQIQGPGESAVGHWIALVDLGDTIEHFDSYGLTMDEELAKTHESPYLKAMMTDSKRLVIQTRARLQAQKADVNTCGRWCVARILSQMGTDEFARFFKSFKEHPDALVSLMTLFL